eukprot:gb/GECG01007868.1/.p1 GENE.gb/GECG01007868.1/~~gb/GECG01007868.1/.p1  ORF type:complete len:665 (+),score=73.80 gb/GECG01007868.1/:1-1995(+)
MLPIFQEVGNLRRQENDNFMCSLQEKILRNEYDSVLSSVHCYLDHREPRVRSSVHRALTMLSRWHGVDIWNSLKVRILELFLRNLEAKEMDDTEVDDVMMVAHDTVGWKAVETAISSIDAMFLGGSVGEPHRTMLAKKVGEPLLLGLVRFCSCHQNRFVRQRAHESLDKIVRCFADGQCSDPCERDVFPTVNLDDSLAYCKTMSSLEGDGLSKSVVLSTTVAILSHGLMDNWSQVRYAATQAAKTLLQSDGKQNIEKYYEELLPKICLNRYYVAAGVRNASQALWESLFPPSEGKGAKDAIVRHIDAFVQYYSEQADSDNHAVREAACHCISELSLKLPSVPLRKHVANLLEVLLQCFDDESWPVRDAACEATGKFVEAFPDECKDCCEEKLVPRWRAHLWDNVWSVRKNSAISFKRYLRAYGDEAYPTVAAILESYLPSVKDQPKESSQYSDLSNTSQFSVAKHLHESDENRHTNQEVYSCGSLAPKLKKRGGGCMDHSFSRQQQLWEATDGALFLLSEVSEVYPEKIAEFLPTVVEVSRCRHFYHAMNLQATIWLTMTKIVKSIKKEDVKAHLEGLIPEIINCAEGPHKQSAHFATLCLQELARQVGARVLEAHLTENQTQSMACLLPRYHELQSTSTSSQREKRQPSKNALAILNGAKLQR